MVKTVLGVKFLGGGVNFCGGGSRPLPHRAGLCRAEDIAGLRPRPRTEYGSLINAQNNEIHPDTRAPTARRHTAWRHAWLAAMVKVLITLSGPSASLRV